MSQEDLFRKFYPDTCRAELRLKQEGYQHICGVDEVGRGPLAGPVYACALILPEERIPQGIKDSKRISEKKRERLADEIMAVADYGIGVVEPKIIDEINILEATKRAMHDAVLALEQEVDFVLVDAVNIPDLDIPQKALVKGDDRSVTIAAASIVAKVLRDRLMRHYDEIYPGYGFAQHKGYGTKAHREAILERGPCPIHRMSFLTKLLGNR